MSDLAPTLPDWMADPTHDPPEVRSAVERERPKLADSMPSEMSPPGPPRTRRFPFVGSAAFASGDYRPEWLISRILVRGQPGVIAGPSKALKTNLSIEKAISLAAGMPFLGQFGIAKRTRVAVVSGESGQHTLQETANRVCRAKGITLDSLEGYLDWCFTLPTFSDLGNMAEFANELAKLNAEVVIIDPVYLALGAVDAKNLFEAGAAFRVVAEVLLKVGCTPILVHHANRQLQVGEPMELQNLAYSGLEQFARQFVLLNRREKYQGDGVHDLWCTVGGSAGHGGLWSLHIEEGTIGEDFSGREWNVSIQTRSETQEHRVEKREARRQEEARLKLQNDERDALAAIDAEVGAGHPGATKSAIQTRHPRFSAAKVTEILNRLLDRNAIEEVTVEKQGGNKAKRAATGYRRAGQNESRALFDD